MFCWSPDEIDDTTADVMSAPRRQVLDWELREVVQMAQQHVIIANSPVKNTDF